MRHTNHSFGIKAMRGIPAAPYSCNRGSGIYQNSIEIKQQAAAADCDHFSFIGMARKNHPIHTALIRVKK